MESRFDKYVSFKMENEDWIKFNKIAVEEKTTASHLLRKLIAKEIQRRGL